MSASVTGVRQIFDDVIVQHLLDEGLGRVAAGDGIVKHGIDEAGEGKFRAGIARVTGEMQGKASVSQQPTLLRGEYGGQARACFIDVQQRLRLRLDMTMQRRMADNIFEIQRHPPRPPASPPAAKTQSHFQP